MNIVVSEFERKFAFELEPVTQLCGQNIALKAYVLDSIRKYFSSHKYAETRNKWRDNVHIDGELLGRKYFSVLSIRDISDLIAMIKLSKQSLMLEYLHNLMQQFEWQSHLEAIDYELERIFQDLNEKVQKIGNIEFDYSASDLWDIIQKSDVVGNKEEMLEDKTASELFFIALNLIEEVLKENPKKILVIIENADHILSAEEYREAIKHMQQACMKYDIRFLLTTSLDGYVVCSEDLCRGISVFNDQIFQFPSMEEMQKAINDNYPCYKNFTIEQLGPTLEDIVQKIGRNSYLTSVESEVVCKIINQSLLLDDRWKTAENTPEISFLKA